MTNLPSISMRTQPGFSIVQCLYFFKKNKRVTYIQSIIFSIVNCPRGRNGPPKLIDATFPSSCTDTVATAKAKSKTMEVSGSLSIDFCGLWIRLWVLKARLLEELVTWVTWCDPGSRQRYYCLAF